MALVLCFSAGLALTLMLSGALAAWGARRAAQRWRGLDTLATRAPYGMSVVLIALGLAMAVRGLVAL